MSRGTSPALLGFAVFGMFCAAVMLGGAAGAVMGTQEWVERVLRRVSKHEGGFDATNPNRDGAGLSYGILQWTQKSGNLGVLLREMQRAAPGLFVQVFGGGSIAASEALLRAVAPGMPVTATAGGVLLWQEPWVSRFKAAGKEPAFQVVQVRLATTGDHWKGALQAARIMQLTTERSVALMFDTSVQQGPARAVEIATWINARYPHADPIRKLEAYAQRAADYFVNDTPLPARPGSEWRLVDGRYHKFALPWGLDLYEDVRRRRMGIVNDPALLDTTVTI